MEEIDVRLSLSKEQWGFLRELGLTDREYTEKELDDLVIETVAEHLQLYGFRRGQDGVNRTGEMCESIIDAVEESRHPKG